MQEPGHGCRPQQEGARSGFKLDTEGDPTKCKEREMLVVFNQNPNVAANTTIRVPLYYSGLDTTAVVSSVESGVMAT